MRRTQNAIGAAAAIIERCPLVIVLAGSAWVSTILLRIRTALASTFKKSNLCKSGLVSTFRSISEVRPCLPAHTESRSNSRNVESRADKTHQKRSRTSEAGCGGGLWTWTSTQCLQFENARFRL